MSGNTSATGGYLSPVAPLPLTQQAIENLLHDMLATIMQLDPTLVRPRWQPQMPSQPSPTTNWCAFGITLRSRVDYPYVLHHNGGPDEMRRQERLEVLISVYGPGCEDNAAAVRDALYIGQNWEALNAASIRLLDVSDITAVPELTNLQWINRCDLTLRCNRQVVTYYNILDIASSQGTITVDDGVHASWDTNNV